MIVSQDRRKVLNMNKVLSVYRSNKEIGAEYPFEDGWADLGRYETEERAKKVLQEIVSTYSKIGIVFDTYNGGKAQQLPIFEMPED